MSYLKFCKWEVVIIVNLKETVEVVTERMKKHRSFYEGSEMAIRGQIAYPILKSLWDTEKPEEAQPNVFIEEGVPDYGLLKNGQTLRRHTQPQQICGI